MGRTVRYCHSETADDVMRSLDRVRFIERSLRADARGWFLKVIDGQEEDLPPRTGEIYLTLAEPGQVRGNHYHPKTAEWFTVVLGQAQLRISDPLTRDFRDFWLDAANPCTIYVPAGLGHAFKNPDEATSAMILVAYADRPYQPNDTIPLEIL